MAKYVYPAVFSPEIEGGFYINFPDLECCFTQGDDLADGLLMAKDVLELVLYRYETQKLTIPEPSDIKSIALEENQIVSLVMGDTYYYTKLYNTKLKIKNIKKYTHRRIL